MISTRYSPKSRRPGTASRRSNASRMITVKKSSLRGHKPDWSNINIHLLEHIVHKKMLCYDLLKSRAVCSSWRSVVKTHISTVLKKSSTTSSLTPILWSAPYSFLDASKGVEGNLRRDTPEFKSLNILELCVGFSNGYFITWSREKSRLCLFHPQLQLSFTFPLISREKKKYELVRAVLWGDPVSAATSSYGIVVAYSGYHRLMFAKCGATKFVELECQDRAWKTTCLDVICVNGCVYAITGQHYDTMQGRSKCVEDHRMESWDCVGVDNPRKVFDFKPSFRLGFAPACQSTLHLVESEGDLLLVTITRPSYRSPLWYENESSRFRPVCRVYKMDFKGKEWVYIDSLGDRVLFIMEYQTMSLSAREFPQYQSNSIYFRHYNPRPYTRDSLGIFNYEDGSVKEIHTRLKKSVGTRSLNEFIK